MQRVIHGHFAGRVTATLRENATATLREYPLDRTYSLPVVARPRTVDNTSLHPTKEAQAHRGLSLPRTGQSPFLDLPRPATYGALFKARLRAGKLAAIVRKTKNEKHGAGDGSGGVQSTRYAQCVRRRGRQSRGCDLYGHRRQENPARVSLQPAYKRPTARPGTHATACRRTPAQCHSPALQDRPRPAYPTGRPETGSGPPHRAV